jgi:hypothetical protein
MDFEMGRFLREWQREGGTEKGVQRKRDGEKIDNRDKFAGEDHWGGALSAPTDRDKL